MGARLTITFDATVSNANQLRWAEGILGSYGIPFASMTTAQKKVAAENLVFAWGRERTIAYEAERDAQAARTSTTSTINTALPD